MRTKTTKNKIRNAENEFLKKVLTAEIVLWKQDPKDVNYCEGLVKKYGGDYNFYCKLSRRFFGTPIRKKDKWLWVL